VDPIDSITLLLGRLCTLEWSGDAGVLQSRLVQVGFEVAREAPHRTDLLLVDVPIARCALYRTGRLECTVKIAMDPQLLDEDKWNDMHERFVASWCAARDRLASSLGPPQFDGRPGDPGMPDDEDAVRLAHWPQQGRQVSVQYRHEDRELPMRLVLVVTPINQ